MSQIRQQNPVSNYNQVVDFLETNFDEVPGDDFYRDIFPDNEYTGEHHVNKHYSRPNAIYLYQDERDNGTKRRLRRRIMLTNTWDDDFCEFVERNPLTLCSGLSYRGRANKLENAQRMNALIFDLDNVGFSELENLFMRFKVPADFIRSVPLPTYIVTSGSGLHLYYVFRNPIDLYPNIKLQLKAMKYDLTFRIWDYKGTTQKKTVQYQSINQGFRMVGSINNKYGSVVRAFQIGDKVKLDYLNLYVDEEHKVDITKPFKPTMSLDAAKEAYPDWYDRKVVHGEQKQHWTCKPDLYEWWKRHVNNILGGHRYFFLMCLAIYGCKCDIPKKQVKKDMLTMFEKLKTVKHDNPLTLDDVSSALEAYDKSYYCFTIDDIEKLCNVRIERNRRNYRPQALHLKLARAIQKINDEAMNTNWRQGNGRKPKNKQIYEYRLAHPEARKVDCIRNTGLSKPTVYKWWDWKPTSVDILELSDTIKEKRAYYGERRY